MEAMMLVQPNYLRYGAGSPHFSDVGKARREWILRGRWREFSLDEIGDQFRWYEAEIGSRDVAIAAKDKEIAELKKSIAGGKISC